MFKWITEIEYTPYSSFNDNGELHIKKMDSTVVTKGMSPVCQFIASFDVILGVDSVTSLPTPNDKALKTILREVVPHYSEVKQIFIDGKLKEINVRGLKKESKKMVQDLLPNAIYPVIPDLYRTKNLNLTTEPRELKYYLVNQDMIESLYFEETEEIQEFFVSSFFTERGSLMLQPTGWKLDHHLEASVTIRAFSTFAQKMVLVVDQKDMSIVGLDIYG